jgi:hypothetical protein
VQAQLIEGLRALVAVERPERLVALGPSVSGVAALGARRVTNTAGTIPGVIGVFASGLILEWTGSWALVFQVAAGITLFGLVFFWPSRAGSGCSTETGADPLDRGSPGRSLGHARESP